MQFKGFKPEAMQRIAGTLGYQGDMNGFNTYLNQNPDKMSKMNMYQNKAMEMAKGGMVKKPSYAVGGVTTSATGSTFAGQQDTNYNKETGEYTPVSFGLVTPDTLSGVVANPTAPLRGGDTVSALNGFYKDNIFGPIDGKQSPDVDQGFYNSQEYRDFQNNPNNRVGSADMYDSPYFGSMGSGSLGQAQDRAYEAYLANKPATVDPRTSVGGVPQTGAYEGQSVSELIANRAIDPSLAYGATVQPVGTQVTGDQFS